MPYCSHCGSPVRATSRFCGQCGNQLRASPVRHAGAAVSTETAVPGTLSIHVSVGRLSVPLEGALLSHVRPGDEQALFGFRFETLPDWLSAPDVMGRSEAEKLAWTLQKWQQFISNTWKWKRAAFALRFLSRPDQGVIDATLLVRVSVPQQARAVATSLAADLDVQLSALHLSPQPLPDVRSLEVARRSVPMESLVEVRQHETVVQMNLGQAYLVQPLRKPVGDFRLVFETLLRTAQPTLLSLCWEPTELAPLERDELGRAASVAQSLADFQYSGEYYQGRWQDPQATLVGEAYSEFVRRLGRPFLCVAHVAGADVPAVWAVGRSLENALSAETPDSPESTRVELDVVQARAPRQAQAVEAAIADLVLVDWDSSPATSGKERLRYLSDAAGVASLARFPIVSRGRAPGFQVKQVAPGYDQGVRRSQIGEGEIGLGNHLSGGVASISVADLTRHGLIVGFTGSGKTNTCLYLVDQLWRRHHIPTLIIEPAKTEYRGLIERSGFEDVLVFTLGDEATVPFRLNPFELLPGVRVEAHVSALKTCFNAALPQFGVLPTIIEEAIVRLYEDKGWHLTDRGEGGDTRLFPTMRDMYNTVIRVAEGRGYSGEVRDNIRAAAAGRIGSLLSGSKGQMFGSQRSIPMETLLGRPVVLELDALNDDEKALAMMLLLMQLREYCKIHRRSGRLAHVTLVEEAHRVLENVASVAGSEVAADTRAEAVRFFSGALAEIRAYGEGFLIAEQSPSKLAPDAVRNTNLKLAHMLLDRQDREAIAGAMMMDEEQERYVGKLPVGQAALFMTGYEKATFIQVPRVKGGEYAERLDDGAVERHMESFRRAHAAAYLPFDGCRYCGAPCRYRGTIEPVTMDRALHRGFQEAVLTFDRRPDPADASRNWADVAHTCALAAKEAGHAHELEAAYCYFVHEIDFPFTRHMRDHFVMAFSRLEDGDERG